MALRIGIIGGTGLYQLGAGDEIEVETASRPVTLHRIRVGKVEAFFLPRHGANHHAPPHRLDHAAHASALAATKCDYVLAMNNVGALRTDLKPGTWAVLADFIDHHRTGPHTAFPDAPVHVDFSHPYCTTLVRVLSTARRGGLPTVVYAGVDGPRFETPAEVAFLRQSGADVVGMTGVPEAIHMRERALCYGGVAFVGNPAAGLGRARTAQAIQASMRRQARSFRTLVEAATRGLPARKSCDCQTRLRGADLRLGGKKR